MWDMSLPTGLCKPALSVRLCRKPQHFLTWRFSFRKINKLRCLVTLKAFWATLTQYRLFCQTPCMAVFKKNKIHLRHWFEKQWQWPCGVFSTQELFFNLRFATCIYRRHWQSSERVWCWNCTFTCINSCCQMFYLAASKKPISYLRFPNVVLDSYCQILMIFYIMDIRSNKHLLDKYTREQWWNNSCHCVQKQAHLL